MAADFRVIANLQGMQQISADLEKLGESWKSARLNFIQKVGNAMIETWWMYYANEAMPGFRLPTEYTGALGTSAFVNFQPAQGWVSMALRSPYADTVEFGAPGRKLSGAEAAAIRQWAYAKLGATPKQAGAVVRALQTRGWEPHDISLQAFGLGSPFEALIDQALAETIDEAFAAAGV